MISSIKPANEYSNGDYVYLPFMRGFVRSVMHGSNKGWQEKWYYLVQPCSTFRVPLKYPPHWVLEHEILGTTRDYNRGEDFSNLEGRATTQQGRIDD